MLEIISILCSLIICIVTPIEVNRIRNGKINKKFANDPQKFLDIYRKQLRMLIFVGLGLGTLTFIMSFLEENPGERVFKLVAGAIWLAVAGICFVSRGRLPTSA
jgi:hypothetical protein